MRNITANIIYIQVKGQKINTKSTNCWFNDVTSIFPLTDHLQSTCIFIFIYLPAIHSLSQISDSKQQTDIICLLAVPKEFQQPSCIAGNLSIRKPNPSPNPTSLKFLSEMEMYSAAYQGSQGFVLV